MPKQIKKTTYSDIAHLSGVSLATISRILTNSTSVKAETKQKVLDAMKKLGYNTADFFKAPKEAVRGLIIFNIPTLDNPFYGLIIQGAKASAARHRYNLLINENHITEKTADGFLDLLKHTKAAGLILANHIETSLLCKINSALPLVQCCECNKMPSVPFVTIDDISAAHSAVNHILSLGKKNIAFINGPIQYKYAKDRLAGYIEALENGGKTVDPALIIQLQEINYDMALSAALQLMHSPNRPDAFFTASDVYAAAVIKAAQQAGLRVPQDIAIVGFDNVEISAMCNPSITTINQPRFQMGFLSCEMLVNRILGNDMPIQNLYLETELIVRNSTASV